MASHFVILLKDTGTLTAAAAQDQAVVPMDCLIVGVTGVAGTAPTGVVATPISGKSAVHDINRNGTTIYGTQANRPAITDGATAVSQTLPDTRRLLRGDRITMDCDYIGSTVAGADVVIALLCKALQNVGI